VICELLFQLEALSEIETNVTAQVAACSKDEVVIEISQDKMNEKDNSPGEEDNDNGGIESKTHVAETGVDVSPNERCTNTSADEGHSAQPASEFCGVHTASQIYRSMSESSGDEFVSIFVVDEVIITCYPPPIMKHGYFLHSHCCEDLTSWMNVGSYSVSVHLCDYCFQ
jgi:hypothetical protein